MSLMMLITPSACPTKCVTCPISLITWLSESSRYALPAPATSPMAGSVNGDWLPGGVVGVAEHVRVAGLEDRRIVHLADLQRCRRSEPGLHDADHGLLQPGRRGMPYRTPDMPGVRLED